MWSVSEGALGTWGEKILQGDDMIDGLTNRLRPDVGRLDQAFRYRLPYIFIRRILVRPRDSE